MSYQTVRVSCLIVMLAGTMARADNEASHATLGVSSLNSSFELAWLWASPTFGERRRESSWDRTGGNRDFFNLPPKGRVTLLQSKGRSGTIRRIWFTLGGGAKGYLETTKLRFCFDGRTTVDNVPVGMLTATGPWRVNDVVSPVVSVMRSRCGNRDNPGTGQGSFNLLWPMPFEDKAIIEVYNDSKIVMTIHYYVDYEFHPVERPLWFHATHHRQRFRPPADKSARRMAIGTDDYVFVDIRNTEGRYVGTVMLVESHPSRAGKWYEGDDRFLVDGKTLLHGTGTEDYFGMAWGFHRPYQGYDHGVTHYERNLTEEDRYFDGRFVTYRWHLVDPISFRDSLRASIEAGHDNECAQHYESVAIWYGRRSERKEAAGKEP